MRRLIPPLLLLGACAAPPTSFVPVNVDKPVPVYVPCQQTIPDEPVWITKTINPSADIYKQSTTLQATIDQHLAYEGQLKDVITSCTTLSPPQGVTP